MSSLLYTRHGALITEKALNELQTQHLVYSDKVLKVTI